MVKNPWPDRTGKNSLLKMHKMGTIYWRERENCTNILCFLKNNQEWKRMEKRLTLYME